MKNHELEIQIGISPCEETPVDNYVQELVAAGTQNPWAYLPNGAAGLPCFRLEDKKRQFITVLVCEAETAEYCQYRLEATNADGETEMRSVEWIAASNSGPLRTLYATLWQAEQDAQMTVKDESGIDPDDDVTMTNEFIDALLLDVQGKRSDIHFERDGDSFVAGSFGHSESTITLTKEWENDESAQFLIKVVKPDGTLLLSCAETSKHTNDEAELRLLYRLLDEKIPIVSIDEGTEDIQRFVENKKFDKFYDRVVQYAIPKMSTLDTAPPERAVLIYDIFESVSEPRVIQQFLDEISIRRGPLSDREYKRLKALAQSVFAFFRNTQRCPNGRVFDTRAVPVAFDKSGLASRGVRWSASLSRIANAYTLWGDVVGQNPAIGEARAMNKVAVLILTAILADQLP